MDFREILQQEFESRIRRNTSYSLRAFARDLEVSPSKLSEALNGHRGFSTETAQKVAKRLKLSAAESAYFIALVESKHGRSEAKRKAAKASLSAIQSQNGFREIDLENFQVLSDWIHFAILELTQIEGFESTVAAVSQRLGRTNEESQAAVERLFRLGLMTRLESGKWIQAEVNVATTTDIPSRAIRDHHREVAKLASEALDEVTVDARDFSSITLAFDSSKMAEAKDRIKKFRRQFNADFQKDPIKDRVYCLAIQFFPLDAG